MNAIARSASLALLGLVFSIAGTGCVQQVESHTNTAPQTTDGSAPTPATATVTPATPAAAAAATDGVKLEKVSYNEFLKRMAANPNQAKFTMVDVWATWCGPCKENFPHVVEMHEKYGSKGLAVASLSFDDPTNAKHVADAEAFLREKRATFSNFLLDEPENAGFDKFNFNGIPVVLIYGPDGKEVKRFTGDDPNNQFTYEQVEKEVVALLDGK